MVWFWSHRRIAAARRHDRCCSKQVYQIGVLSLIIIVLSAFSIGAVLALQGYTQLARVGAEESRRPRRCIGVVARTGSGR